eukprot:gene3171-4881_t
MNSLDRLELLVDDVNSKWRQYQLQRRAQEHGEVNGSGEVKNSGAAKVAAVEGNAAAGGGPGKQLQPPSIIAPDVIGGAILSTPPPATPEQWKDTAAVGTKITPTEPTSTAPTPTTPIPTGSSPLAEPLEHPCPRNTKRRRLLAAAPAAAAYTTDCPGELASTKAPPSPSPSPPLSPSPTPAPAPAPAVPARATTVSQHTPKEGSGFDCDDEDSDVMTHTPQEPPSSAGSAATTPASSGVALKFESDGEPPVTPLDKVKAGKSSNRTILDQPAAAVGKQWPVAAAACAAAANASKATAEEVVAAGASAGAAAGPTMPMSAATAALHAQAQHDLGLCGAWTLVDQRNEHGNADTAAKWCVYGALSGMRRCNAPAGANKRAHCWRCSLRGRRKSSAFKLGPKSNPTVEPSAALKVKAECDEGSTALEAAITGSPGAGCSTDDTCSFSGDTCIGSHCCNPQEISDYASLPESNQPTPPSQPLHCMTGCGSPTVNGSCYPTLAFKTLSTWTSTNVTALLNWPPTVYIGGGSTFVEVPPTVYIGDGSTVFELPQAVANLRAEVFRKQYSGHTPDFDSDKVQYSLFWTPHAANGNDDDTANNNLANFTADYIGMPPPPGLVGNAEETDSVPERTTVDADTGRIIVSPPSKAGTYTMWLLFQDYQLAEYGLSDNPEWNQLVVAQHTFKVVEKPPFKVTSFTRNAMEGAKLEYITDNRLDQLDFVVGGTYRIAPVTLVIEYATCSDSKNLTFTLSNAPPGFFVYADTGEILASPSQTTLNDGKDKSTTFELRAVDACGVDALVQTITVQIKEPGKFDLKLLDPPMRQISGAQYIDPSATTVSDYVVNENYKISRLQLDEAKTILSDGGPTNSLKYTLDGAPDSWFVSAKTGTITGQFETAGIYSFSLVAADGRKEEQVVETFSFTVVEKKAFKVDGFTRRPSQSRDYTATDYTDPTATTTYAVGDTYRFGSIKVTDTSGTASEPGQLTLAAVIVVLVAFAAVLKYKERKAKLK